MRVARSITALAAVTFGLALLALLAPLGGAEHPAARVGVLLAAAAAIEGLHALRRQSAESQRQGTIGAMISMGLALFLINAAFVASGVLRVAIAGWFGLDAARHLAALVRGVDPAERRNTALAAAGNAVVTVGALLAAGWAFDWLVAVLGALRIAGIGWTLLATPVHDTSAADETVVSQLGLSDPRAVAMAAGIEAAEATRAPVDRAWTLSFIATLFAIHVGRMRTDLTLLGMLGPAVAVLGDMAIAILITLLVINPLYLGWRGPTRWVERRAWSWRLAEYDEHPSWRAKLVDVWLRWRMTSAIRIRAARYSIPTALGQGLQTGLPLAAILAATIPVWGMNWYFDTENWAAGIWNSWAESRTDEWREAMVQAVVAQGGASFAVVPPGVGTGDFAFVVIGDTGEGDASQHVLRDQLLSAASQADVRFVVISSDVVYPTGSMNDYEAKFWLPFKGVTKPVYAIPGNHDWYDALEGFAATFLTPEAARASLHARIEADLRATSTTDRRIDALVAEAARLRAEYGVPSGFQRSTFFDVQTDRFALFAVDTGVMRVVDPAQEAWLEAALDRARGKTKMAILGHPFYAGGHDTSIGDEGFERLREQLRRHGVAVVMAGDTHDLEYYLEPATLGRPPVHHFVNGGGGAYLSFGTSLAWPETAPTSEWAYYPARLPVKQKINATTPWWKRPAWWWTDRFAAWPFSAEWLSAAFDYNVAPFFQSFVVVRVEPSANRIVIVPYGVHGRLRWRDLDRSPGMANGEADRLVEWAIPLQ